MAGKRLTERCPFDQGLAIVQTTGSGKKKTYYGICQKCLARTRPCITSAEAEAAWNQRVAA